MLVTGGTCLLGLLRSTCGGDGHRCTEAAGNLKGFHPDGTADCGSKHRLSGLELRELGQREIPRQIAGARKIRGGDIIIDVSWDGGDGCRWRRDVFAPSAVGHETPPGPLDEDAIAGFEVSTMC